MSPRSKEPTNERRLGRAIALPTIFALAAGALTGCAVANAEPSPKPTHSSSAEATPTSNPDVLPAEFNDAANAPDLATFQSLSQAEQLGYCSYETRDIVDVAKVWTKNSGNKLDTLPTLNGNDSAQDLLTVSTYEIRGAWVSHQGGSEVLDQLTAQKVMSCAFTNPNSHAALGNLAALNNGYKDSQVGGAPGIYAGQGKIEVPTATGTPQEETINGNRVVTTNIVFSDGTTDVAKLTTIKGLNYEKKPTYFVTVDYAN